MASKHGEFPELMGAAEVANELGIDVSNVGRIQGMPEPKAQLRATKVWSAEEIRDFARRRGEPIRRKRVDHKRANHTREEVTA